MACAKQIASDVFEPFIDSNVSCRESGPLGGIQIDRTPPLVILEPNTLLKTSSLSKITVAT